MSSGLLANWCRYPKKSTYLLSDVKIISKNSCSQYLMQRVDETLHVLKKNIENIDEKKFKDMKNIILMGLTSESADL